MYFYYSALMNNVKKFMDLKLHWKVIWNSNTQDFIKKTDFNAFYYLIYSKNKWIIRSYHFFDLETAKIVKFYPTNLVCFKIISSNKLNFID